MNKLSFVMGHQSLAHELMHDLEVAPNLKIMIELYDYSVGQYSLIGVLTQKLWENENFPLRFQHLFISTELWECSNTKGQISSLLKQIKECLQSEKFSPASITIVAPPHDFWMMQRLMAENNMVEGSNLS